MTENLLVTRQYSAKDYAALRGFVQKLSPEVLARTYYDQDEDPHAATPSAMERYLKEMLQTLVDLAIEHGSAPLATHLKASIKTHGEPRLTIVSLQMVFEAAKLAAASPKAEHGVGMWFRPLVARNIKSAGIRTLGELVAFCNRRGGSWWRAVQRIGYGRAQIIENWLNTHRPSIGQALTIAAETNDPLALPETVTLEPGSATLIPLERIKLASPLSGAHGINRAKLFSYIGASNDLEAIRTYLHLYREQPKTLRAYTKELERFLLWSVTVRQKPLSSVLVEDCEAYKDFLQNPSERFVGPKAPRMSSRWRPFSSPALSPESQRYAVRVIKAAFSWLVDVRYLDGNPWKAVRDPSIVRRERQIKVDKALPETLWHIVRAEALARSLQPEAVRWRVAAAFLLLAGDCGLRREEVFSAQREYLRLEPIPHSEDEIWALTVIGKRMKERTVPVSEEAVEALRRHWQDRNLDFDEQNASGPLLAPVVLPPTPRAIARHADGIRSYHPNVGNQLVNWMLEQLLSDPLFLSDAQRQRIGHLTPHALRHTFGTLGVSAGIPLDVMQKILGHESLQTTTIYVDSEITRVLTETKKYQNRRSPNLE
ncbi:phage integrase family protein [Robbsia andropogonis]|uniref:phage integrase family protein n=1 Tax=Robbsia andropogonis TaxID=28092 RepID=UPI0020A16F0B|nr:phage integrase family protein [Robbsia andropogonis]MCP1120988.1 site-specific integrase [Robbsia andropogonis]MCP1130831.1 site-specific integrase [Robbsia andropogonis]